VSSLYHKKDLKLIEELQKSNEEGRPLLIKGSAFEYNMICFFLNVFRTYQQKKSQIKKNDGLEKLSSSPELQKLLPADYIEFRKQWDKSNPKPEEEKRVRGYKPGKDIEKTKIKELKKKIKFPKQERTKQRKFIQGVKKKIKRLHKKVVRRKNEKEKK